MLGLPRSFWILWAGALLNRLGSFVMPLLALYLTGERGFAVEQTGLVVALLGAGAFAAAPLGGALADQLGRRRTLVISLVLGGLSMLHLAYARAPAHIAFAAFLQGLCGELYRPAVSAAIADLTAPADRVRAFVALNWAVNLGFAVSGVLGGALAQRGWMLLFWGDALTTLGFALVVHRFVPETQPRSAERVRRDFTAPLADGTFLFFCLLTFVLALVFQQAFVTLPVDLRAHGVGPARYGALIAINGVLIIALQPFAHPLLSRFDRHRLLAAAALLVGAGFGLTAFASTPAQYALTIVVWTLGEILMAGLGPAIVAELAPVELRGAYQGVFTAWWSGAAAFAAPIAGAYVLGRGGGGALWGACFGAGVLACVGQLAFGALRPRPGGGAAAREPPRAPPA